LHLLFQLSPRKLILQRCQATKLTQQGSYS
jgi:hypothetical protein